MDYSSTAKQIVAQIGGEKNVVSVTHCMTRLRFVLKDETCVNDNKVKQIPGVVGVMRKGGQYQIIIGNEVAKCYKEITKLGSFGNDGSAKKTAERKKPVSAVLDAISGCMSPVIPALIGAGMIRVLVIILGWFFDTESQTMQLMSVIGDCAFYFLPILVAYSAGRKFNTNPVLAASVVAILIHPTFTSLLETEGGLHFLGIPVTSASYSSTIIPAILTAWVMSYIEKLVEKITPSFTKNFLKPMLILLISAPISFIILGPLGSLIGNVLATVLIWIQTHASIAAYVIMAAAMPFIVMTGMHWAFIPVVFAALETPEGEALMLPAMLISNLAIGASCFAVALKSKDSRLRQVGASSGVSALFAGVTEPGLYGVAMPLKRPLIALCTASGLTGILAGIMNVTAQSFASPSLLAMPIFVSAEKTNNFLMAIVTAAVSIILSFVLTWILGFKDTNEPVQESTEDTASNDTAAQIAADSDTELTVASPVTGTLIPLGDVNDETFASGVLGAGAAVIPSAGKVFASFDGTVETIPKSRHALGLTSVSGIELLIHVGLETVGMNGKGFTLHTAEGRSFKKGELLLEFDIDAIKAAGCETVTPIVITNADDYSSVTSVKAENVTAGDTVIEIRRG